MTVERLFRQAGTVLAVLFTLFALTALSACGDDDKSTSSSVAPPAAPATSAPATAIQSTSASSSSVSTDASTSEETSSEETTAAAGTIENNPDNAGKTITLGSKNFTEQIVLASIYSQALQAAGYTVNEQFNLGDEQTALKSLKSKQIDAYPEYTGTALLSFFDVPAAELPSDNQEAYDLVKEKFADQNIEAFAPTPFTSSNEVGLTRAKAEELGVTKISDLEGKSQDLTLFGSPECRQRRDCLLGLQQVYGLKFKEFKPVDIALRHEVLQNNQADLSIVFTTDGQIAANDEVILEDDKNMFPPYNVTMLAREDVVEEAGPDFQRVVELIESNLTDEVMQELNSRVDLDKEKPVDVAADYLESAGYITG
jgi:glycine betaine/choline ABC-type transport system substrate-binding protein